MDESSIKLSGYKPPEASDNLVLDSKKYHPPSTSGDIFLLSGREERQQLKFEANYTPSLLSQELYFSCDYQYTPSYSTPIGDVDYRFECPYDPLVGTVNFTFPESDCGGIEAIAYQGQFFEHDDKFSIDFYSGSLIEDASLSISVLLDSSYFTGSDLEESNLLVFAQLSCNTLSGQVSEVDLSLSPAFPLYPLIGKVGSTLDSIEAQYTVGFNVPLHTGEAADLTDIQIGYPIPLGDMVAYTGEQTPEFILKTWFVTAVFYATANATTIASVDIDSTTFFDSNTRNDPSRVDFDLDDVLPYTYESAYSAVEASLDLWTNPRMRPEASEGVAVTLRLMEYTLLSPLPIEAAERALIEPVIVSEDYNTRNCLGSLIPNATYIETEMTLLPNENCYADVAFAGESAEFTLSYWRGIYPRIFFSGEYAGATLTLSPPWEILFKGGQNIKCELSTNDSLIIEFGNGAYARAELESIDYSIEVGSYLKSFSLVEDISIEWLEEGCLKNEYIPQTEDGDLDHDNAISMNYEQAPFKHTLKARCKL